MSILLLIILICLSGLFAGGFYNISKDIYNDFKLILYPKIKGFYFYTFYKKFKKGDIVECILSPEYITIVKVTGKKDRISFSGICIETSIRSTKLNINHDRWTESAFRKNIQQLRLEKLKKI